MIQKQSEKRIFIFLLLDFLSQAFQNHVAVGKQGGLSDRASYRESDDIKFIYFYQMDGVVIWIYAFFFG